MITSISKKINDKLSLLLVTGVYVTRIFVEELGASPDNNVRRIIPLDNFGELHPDPNLTYAKDLVDKVKDDTTYDLGAAFDGDGVTLSSTLKPNSNKSNSRTAT